MKPTLKETSIVTWALAITILICFTAIFCSSKIESTAIEQGRATQLQINLIRAKTDLELAKKEYRPMSSTMSTVVLGTSYQVGVTRFTFVTTTAQISSTLSLSGGQSGTVSLQTSPDNSTWTTIATETNNSTGSLTLGLNLIQVQATSLCGFVPPGYYFKVVSSGTSTFSQLQCQLTQI